MAAGLAEKYDGVSAPATKGDTGTPSVWNHRRVQSGRAILTFHSAQYPSEDVRFSYARRQYSATCAKQMVLFEKSDPEGLLADDDWIVYGQVLHGASDIPGVLGFAVVRFPLASGDTYYAATIDLFKLCPNVVAEMHRSYGLHQDDEDEPPIDFHEGEEHA